MKSSNEPSYSHFPMQARGSREPIIMSSSSDILKRHPRPQSDHSGRKFLITDRLNLSRSLDKSGTQEKTRHFLDDSSEKSKGKRIQDVVKSNISSLISQNEQLKVELEAIRAKGMAMEAEKRHLVQKLRGKDNKSDHIGANSSANNPKEFKEELWDQMRMAIESEIIKNQSLEQQNKALFGRIAMISAENEEIKAKMMMFHDNRNPRTMGGFIQRECFQPKERPENKSAVYHRAMGTGNNHESESRIGMVSSLPFFVLLDQNRTQEIRDFKGEFDNGELANPEKHPPSPFNQEHHLRLLKELEAENQQIRETVERLRTEKEEIRNEYESIVTEKEKAHGDIEKLKKEVRKFQEESQKAQKEREKAQRESEMLREQVHGLDKLKLELRIQLEDQKSKEEQRSLEFLGLKGNLTVQENEIKNLKKTLQRKKEKLRNFKLFSGSDENERLKREVKILEEVLGSISMEKEQQRKTIEDLRTELGILRARMHSGLFLSPSGNEMNLGDWDSEINGNNQSEMKENEGSMLAGEEADETKELLLIEIASFKRENDRLKTIINELTLNNQDFSKRQGSFFEGEGGPSRSSSISRNKEKLGKYEEEIVRLSEELMKSKKTQDLIVKENKERIEEFRKEVETKKEEIKKVLGILMGKVQEQERIKEHNKELEQEIGEKTKEIEGLRGNLKEKLEENEKEKKCFTEEMKEIAKLNESLKEKAQKLSKELKELREVAEKEKNQQREREMEIRSKMEGEMQRKDSELSEMKEKLEELSIFYNERTEKLGEEQKEAEKQKKIVQEIQKGNSEREGVNESQETKKEEENARTALWSLQEDFILLKEELGRVWEELETTKGEKEKLENSKRKLKEKTKEKERWRDSEVQKMQTELNDTRELLGIYEERLKRKKEEGESPKKEIKRIQEKKSGKSPGENEKEEKMGEIGKEEAIEGMMKEEVNADEASPEVMDAEKETKEEKRQGATKEKERNQESKWTNTETQETKEEFEGLKRELEEARKEIGKNSMENGGLKQKVEEMTKSMQKMQFEINKKTSEIKRLKATASPNDEKKLKGSLLENEPILPQEALRALKSMPNSMVDSNENGKKEALDHSFSLNNSKATHNSPLNEPTNSFLFKEAAIPSPIPIKHRTDEENEERLLADLELKNKEILELRRDNTNLVIDLEKIAKEFDKKWKESEVFKGEAKRFQKKALEAEARASETQKEAQVKSEELSKTTKKLNETKNDLRNLRKTHEKVTKDLEKLIETLERRSEERNEENKRLKEESNGLKEALREAMKETKRKIDEKEEKMKRKEEELDELMKELEGSQGGFTRLRKAFDEQRKQYEILKRELEQAKESLGTKTLKENEEEMGHETKEKEPKEEEDAEDERNNEKNGQPEIRSEKEEDGKNHKEGSVAENNQKREKGDKPSLNDTGITKEELSVLMGKIEGLELKLREKEEELQALKKEYRGIQSAYNIEKENFRRETMGKSDSLAKMEEEIRRLSEKCEKLERRAMNSENKSSYLEKSLVEKKNKIEEIQKELDDSERSLSDLDYQFNEQNKKLEKYKLKYKASKPEIEKLKSELENKELQSELWQKRAIEAESQIAQELGEAQPAMRTILEKIKRDLDARNSELLKITKESQRTSAKVKKYKERKTMERTQAEKMKEEIHSKIQENEILQRKLMNLEREMIRVSRDSESKEEILEKLREQIMEMSRQNKEMVKSYEDKIEKMTKTIKELTSVESQRDREMMESQLRILKGQKKVRRIGIERMEDQNQDEKPEEPKELSVSLVRMGTDESQEENDGDLEENREKLDE